MAETTPGEVIVSPDLDIAVNRLISLEIPQAMAKVYDDVSRHKEGSRIVPFVMTSDAFVDGRLLEQIKQAETKALTELDPPVSSSVIHPLTWETSKDFIPGAGLAVVFSRDTNSMVSHVGLRPQKEPHDAFIVLLDAYGLRIGSGEYIEHFNHNDGTLLESELRLKSPIARPQLGLTIPFKPYPNQPEILPDPQRVTMGIYDVYNNWAPGRKLGRIKNSFLPGPAKITNIQDRKGKGQ